MSHRFGETTVKLKAVISSWDSESETYNGGEIRAELYLYPPDAKPLVTYLEKEKDEIEKEFGRPLIWSNPEDQGSSRLYVRISSDISDQDDWPKQHQWLKDNLVRMHNVLKPKVVAGLKFIRQREGK